MNGRVLQVGSPVRQGSWPPAPAARIAPGRRGAFAALVAAACLARGAIAESWSEHFEGDRLSPAWTVDRSGASNGALRLERGRLVITAEEARYHHIERKLGLDGTDRAPLRVDCQMAAPLVHGLPTVLALYWGPDCVIGVGPVQRQWNQMGARAYWILGDERGASPVDYELGPPGIMAHYRIVVSKRDVSAWASRDGEAYWRVASFERGKGRFEGPCELLILGRGWVGDSREQQRPDLDNDVGNVHQKTLHTFVFDAVSVTNDIPVAPGFAPAGYEKGEDWEKTLEGLRSRQVPGPWFVLGPLAPRRLPYGPEQGALARGRITTREGESFCVELGAEGALRDCQEGDYTLAAWVRPDSVPSAERPEEAAFAVIMKPGWHLGLYYSSEQRFVMNHVLSDDSQVAAKSARQFPPGSFHHAVGVVSRAKGTVEVYVDGKLEGSASFPPGKAARKYGDAPWRLGAAMPQAADWRFEMDGAIDDARIYRAALSASEVAELHAALSPPALLAAVADDPDGGDAVLSAGDTLTLLFDCPTNRPPVRSKADVDGLVSFGTKRLGASYSGAWKDDRTLVITVQDPAGGNLSPGDAIGIVADGRSDLRDKNEQSAPSKASIRLTGNWGAPPQEGIVGWWRFDEERGDAAADSSGNGNAGKVLRSSDKGSFAWRRPGAQSRTGGALRFKYWKHHDSNRTEGAYVEVADSASLNPRAAITIALWANADRWGNYGFYWPALVRKDGQYELGSHEVNRLRFYLELPSGTEFVECGAPPTGSWHHLAATYDGARMRLFVDGKETASKPASGEIRKTASPLRIGGRLEGESKFYDGLLDDVRIYQRALGELELAELARRETPEGTLVGHWRLDETADTVAYDSSGHGNHGRVSGGVWVKGRIGGAVASARKELSWTAYQPPEGSPADVVDFAQVWGTSAQEPAVGFACAKLVAEEPRRERIVFDGQRRVEVFLNGMPVGVFESEEESLVPDRRLVTVALSRGENELVFKVERGRGPWRFVCRTEPAEPAVRIGLLKQLSSDFPDETERILSSRFEIARLWESAGCLAAAADALGELAGLRLASPDDVRTASLERVRLLRLLRDEAAVASSIRAMIDRTPLGSPERLDLELDLLESVARADSQAGVKEALARIEQASRERPALLARALSLLAGLAEERSRYEERISWLRRLVRERTAAEAAGLSVDALAVECAEAILAPVRTAVAQQKPPPEKALREGLAMYREALAAHPGAASPLVEPIVRAGQAALDEGKLVRALELLPVAYARACLVESDAGARMLRDVAGISLPAPKEEPGKRDFDRANELVRAGIASTEQVTGWHVVGPFDNRNWKAYEEEIVPPDRVDVTRPVRGKQWKVPPPEAYARGFLDLRSLMDADESVAFLYKEIELPSEQETELRIGSDDGCTVWVNGNKLYEDREQRALVPDQIVVPVRLAKGKTRILVRVQNGTNDWAFTMRIGGPRARVPDLARHLYLMEYFPERHADVAQGFLDLQGSLLRAGRFEEAVSVARVLTKAFPSNPVAQSYGACGIADFGAQGSRNLGTAIEFADWMESCAERRSFREEPGCVLASRRQAAFALRVAGDLSGAVERLRRIASSAQGGDAVPWALAEIGSIYRDAGYPQAAARAFREALASRAGDEGLRRRAYASLEEARRARPEAAAIETSAEAQTLVRTADRAARGAGPGALERALRGYQQAAEEHARALLKLGGSKYVGVPEYCADRLRAMGPEAAAAYRELFDARAKALYERASVRAFLDDTDGGASGSSDLGVLQRLAVVYPLSAFAPRALNLAGNVCLARGTPDWAVCAFRDIVADHPDADMDRAMLLAKLAFAEERAGNVPGALRTLEELGKNHAGARLVVSGRTVSAGEYASAQRRRLTASSPTKIPALAEGQVPRRSGPELEVRFPEDHVDLAARRFLWPSPYRHVTARAAVGQGAVFLHTFEEAFSIELATGRLLWRSGPRVGFAGSRPVPSFGGMPETEPALGDGRVYVRALVGAAASAGDSPQAAVFAIEARDAATGELAWSTETAPELAGLSAASPPVLSGGVIYAAFQEPGESSRVWAVALDEPSGRLLWRTALASGAIGVSGGWDNDDVVRLGDHLSRPAVPPDGRGDCYFSTDLGAVAALRRATGTVRWITTYPRAVFPRHGFSREKHMLAARPGGRVIAGGDAIYVAPRDALTVLCIRRDNGDLVWKRDLCDARMLVGLAGQQRLVVQGIAVECLDAATGSRLWRFAPPREAGAIYGACELGGENVYVPTERGLYRLRVGDGGLRDFVPWDRTAAGDRPVGNLVLLEDGVLGCDGSRLVKMDAWSAPGAGAQKSADVVRAEIPGQVLRGQPLASAGLPADAAPETNFQLALDWRLPRASPVELPTSVHEPADAAAGERYLDLAGALARVNVTERKIEWLARLGLAPTRLAFTKTRVIAAYPKHVLALDRASGEILWTHAIVPDDSGFRPDTGDDRAFGELSAAEDLVAVRQSDSPHIHILDARTGRRLSRVEVPGCACVLATGGRFFAGLADDRGRFLVQARDPSTGALVWSQPLDLQVRNWHLTRVFADGGDMVFYTEGRLLRFDAAGRKVVFNEQVRSLGEAEFRREGGYLVLTGKDGERWRTVCLEPGTGKTLFDEQLPPDSDRRGCRYSPGRALIVRRRERERDWLFVCRKIPGGEELWRRTAGSHEDDHLWGLAAGRLWIELFARSRGKRAHTWGDVPGIFYRAFDLENGAPCGEGELPGSPPSQGRATGPRALWAGGHLLYCTREGVSAASCLAPVEGKPPIAAAVGKIAAELAARAGPAAEGAGAFLAAYSRVSRQAFATAASVRIDGRLDDWEGVEPLLLDRPTDARALGGEWRGPEDLSARLRAQWDRRYLYISAEVTDDVFVPPAPGAALSSGDSLVVGLDPKDCGADSPDPQADILLELALVGGRTRMRQLRGPPVDSQEMRSVSRAVRTRDGLIYELAIPWGALRPSPDERPGRHTGMGLAVAVVDRDAPGDATALELGGGLVLGLQPRLFARLELVEVARERLAQYRKFVDMLPSHRLAWRFLERILQASPDRAAELEGFLKAHPDSAHAAAALASLVLEYRKAAPGGESAERRAESFALRAGVPKRAIGDALGPSKATDGLGRAFRQWVFLDPQNPPQTLMLQFLSSEGWWSQRCYWGADTMPWGRPFTRERWPLGPLPQAGQWAELIVPVGALGLGNHTIHQIGFASSGGTTWWDRTEYVHDGQVRVLIDDALPEGTRFEGGSRARWVEERARSGKLSHTAGPLRGVGEYHTEGPSLGVETRPGKEEPPASPEALRSRMELAEKGAHIIAEENESLDLLREAEALHEEREAVARMYERFLRANPRTPLAYKVLGRMRAVLEPRAESEPARADPIARCEALMNELRLDREQRRLFYRDFAPGIRRWKVLGYLDAGAGARNLETALPPEAFPVNLNATYRGTGQETLSWRELRVQGQSVKLSEVLPRPETEYPVAYLYTRLDSPRAQRGVLFLGCAGGLRVWVNGRAVGTSTWGEFLRDSISIPVQLSAGTNDILLKVVHQRAAGEASCRVADGNGRPLEGVSLRLPIEVESVRAASDPPRVTIVFSDPVERASAETAANYRIDGGVTVEGAKLAPDGRTVVLETSALERGKVYTLSVNGVRDSFSPPSPIEPGTARRFRVVGSGRGLRGEYFGNMELADLKVTRIDPTIDFDWGNDSPHPSVGADRFSVRWTGQVEPLFSETYTFHTISDDGVRLWVDGKLVVDNWSDHAPTENTGQIALEGYRRYEIKMEFYENGGGAVAKLLWSSPSQPRETIPATQLYPPQ